MGLYIFPWKVWWEIELRDTEGMKLTEEIVQQDAIIHSLYKKYEKSKIPIDQTRLLKQIDVALDRRLELMKANEEEDLAAW